MESNLRRFARFVSGKLLPRRPYRVLMGPLKGSRFVLGSMSGEGGGASVYFGEMEPEQTAAMTAMIKPGDVLFDIGANVGYYSILASRLVGENGRVVAFEPLPRNVDFLERHIELNDAGNVTVQRLALSDKRGMSRFTTGQNSAMGHIGKDGELEVETVSLDEVVAELGITPDVIKMDVEGSEMDVFRGGEETLKRAKPSIFLSTHSDELRTSCLSFLQGLGYKVQTIDVHEFLAVFDERLNL